MIARTCTVGTSCSGCAGGDDLCLDFALPLRPHNRKRRCRSAFITAASNGRLGRQPSLQTLSPEPVTPAQSGMEGPDPLQQQKLRSYEVSLWDAMKFGGPAPHIVNKRLAMLGMLWGAKLEAQTSQTIADQAASRPLLVFAVVALTTVASLVPIMKGVKSEAFGRFSPKAEVVNGRAACLGFAALLLLESRAQVPFF